MGYENIGDGGANYNIGCHAYAPDQKQHILMDVHPFMLDDTTPKTRYALALKGLSALDGEQAMLVNQATVNANRSDLDAVERMLNEAGLANLKEKTAQTEAPTESAE